MSSKSACLVEELPCDEQGFSHPVQSREFCCEAYCKSTDRRCRNKGLYKWLTGSLLLKTRNEAFGVAATFCSIHDREASKIYDLLPMAFTEFAINNLSKKLTEVTLGQHQQVMGIPKTESLLETVYKKSGGIQQKKETLKNIIRAKVVGSEEKKREDSN